MMKEKVDSHDSEGPDKSILYAGYVGFQLDYNLNDRMSIGLNSNYEHVINSMYVDQNPDYGTSKLNAINSTLRIGYNF